VYLCIATSKLFGTRLLLRIYSSILCLVFSISNCVLADEFLELESTLVTGVYSPAESSSLTGTVTVLDLESLQLLNTRSVSGALKTVPGIQVEELGGPGGLAAVSIRGGEANFTLVLLDGVAINDPTNTRGGGVDFSRLDSASVERIEVVRGPQSSIYGSNALAGVVNIISRRATAGHQQQLRASWGEDDFNRYRLSASGVEGEFRYSFDWTDRDSGEPVPGSMLESDESRVRLGWQPGDSHEFEIGFRTLAGHSSSYPQQSGGPIFAASDVLELSDFKDEVLDANWRWQVTPQWVSLVKTDRFEHKEDYNSPGIIPFTAVPPNGSETQFVRRQTQWVNTVIFDERYWMNVGADHRREEGESIGYLEFSGFALPTDFELDRDSVGLFTDIQASISENLRLHGSMRHDDFEDFSSETTLKLGVGYQFNTTIGLFANWGEGFKLPSFFALGHPLVGNPDLDPETAESWDLGLRWEPSDLWSVQGVYFDNNYRDLVDFDSELFTNVNRNQVKSSGVELELNWQPQQDLNVLAQVTYTDIEVKNSSVPLLGRPQWRAGAAVDWQVLPSWRAAVTYQWTGKQYSSSLHTGESVIDELDSYTIVNCNVRWRLSEHLSFDLAADNLLDERYANAVGFIAPGLSLRLGFTLGTR
jgi:vitamin B12 transporter